MIKSLHACLSNFKVGSGGIWRERTGTPSCSASGVLMLNFIMSDFHNYKVLYGEKLLAVKMAKLRLIFIKKINKIRFCSFSALCVFNRFFGGGGGGDLAWF